MKKLFSLMLLLACTIALVAQVEMPNDLWTLDQEESHGCEYVANEVIVKFKHSSPVRIQRHNTTRRFVSASVTEVDMVLDSLGIFDVEDLMPLTGHMVSQKVMTVGGKRLAPDQNLSKLCNIVFDTAKVATVDEAIMMLERLSDVEYAEPNYIVRVMTASAEDTIYNHTDAKSYTKEPLYSHQWSPKAINLPWLWEQPKSKKRPVIAIIDTGVDIEHPDLKDNIWSNEAEINGAGGKDDDKNGFFDDIHGYDFVNNTGVIGDRNGHGTHCAGIAAAVGNNGIGITGANPDALIMPIQVMDKSGSGNIATIIKGIDYANANGADILSMSIGGYCYSSAEEEALLKAFYNGKYLVAAAGNDNVDIYQLHPMCVRYHMFPGAFKFVIGVMATDKHGNKASFSNYDSDGPYFSEYDPAGPAFFGDYYNYDIAAPGAGIMSTFLNGTYREMSGTSMSTPLVAGALSRLLQCRTFSSQENCQGLLIQTRDTNTYNNIDIKAALTFDELAVDPVLVVSHYHIVDTINGGNGDGLINPGETIEIYPTVRCIYGQANGISVRINQGLNVDTSRLEVIKNDAKVGLNLSPGASFRCREPIIAKVAKQCGDGYTIQLYPTIHVDSTSTINMASAYAHKLVLTIDDKHYISGVLDSTLTLYPDKEHIIDGFLALGKNAILTIKPGTTIMFTDNSAFSATQGVLNATGTPDSLITFTMAPGHKSFIHYIDISPSVGEVSYAIFKGFGCSGNSIFRRITAYNCIFEGNYTGWNEYYPYLFESCKLHNSNIILNKMISGMGQPAFAKNTHFYNCNITNNIIAKTSSSEWEFENNASPAIWSAMSFPHSCNVFDNYTTKNEPILAACKISSGVGVITMEDPSYFGTYNEDKIREGIWDIHKKHGLTEFNIDNRLSEPALGTHGIVWKVLIDGEEILGYADGFSTNPIGVGKHKFDVYYNRAMDTSINPTISFGVREPYTQHIVAEDPSWSVDSTIFTAYYTIGARTMTDGVNHVHITGGCDNEKFPTVDETTRFDIIVQATGSLATGLFAEAGLGKVTLQWHTDEEDFEDLMGYHIYRWTEGATDSVIINDVLLTPEDTMFVDYNVVPGTSYYYTIQQVTTSFAEYNFSNPVCATPLTATKGDANGSMNVDVADVVTEVAYLTGANPQPFIFEAADVNTDHIVNILDIVGTVNIITNPAVSSLGFSDNNTATYSIEDGILYIETPVVLGGVQFAFNADAEISVLEALNGFETTTWTTASNFNFMAYSMSGKVLEVGKHALLYVGDAELSNIVLSNAQGQNVPAIKKMPTSLSSIEAMQMRLPNPNPFTTIVNIPYIVGQTGAHEVRLVFANVAGLTVDSYSATQTFGEYTYTWRPGALPEGVYFVTLYVDGKKIQSSKLVKVN